jgi:hypothetical protein
VTLAELSQVNVPVARVNVAVVALDGTVMPAGADTKPVVAIAIVDPPAGAGWDSVTVQVAPAFDVSVDGEHCSVLGTMGANEMADVAEVPLSDAVIVALPLVVPTVTAAENDPVFEPAAIAVDAGTITLPLFDAITTETPAAGTVPESVIVQELAPDTHNAVGVQLSPLSVAGGGGGAFIAVTNKALPEMSAPRVEFRLALAALPGTVSVAITPFGIVSVPMPYAMQL